MSDCNGFSDKYNCKGSGKCISDYDVCNGYIDCESGSDEDPETCDGKVCKKINAITKYL